MQVLGSRADGVSGLGFTAAVQCVYSWHCFCDGRTTRGKEICMGVHIATL